MVRVLVLSPHLDDAIFSLGAGIAAAARQGTKVTILTVLAGDPSSDAPAGQWDAAAGFRTAGEAARNRRIEDERACARVGAESLWLPYSDEQYSRGADDVEIARSIEAAAGRVDFVLFPGFPLAHSDHRWLARVAEGIFGSERSARYSEQPYAALWTSGPPNEHAWLTLETFASAREAKMAACREYATQLPLLAPELLQTVERYERLRGGEMITAPTGTSFCDPHACARPEGSF